MGRILNLKPPYQGLSRIVNVLAPVGFDEQNDPDDVRVVQNLLHAITLTKRFTQGIGIPQVTGRFDALTGFWIYTYQVLTQGGNGEVDGTVSPAQGGAYHGGIPWFIVRLNAHAHAAQPAVWERFATALDDKDIGTAVAGIFARRQFGFP
jgi:hypothetical protein